MKAKMSATKSNGVIDAQVVIDAKQLLEKAEKEGSPDKPVSVSLQISSNDLAEQLKEEDVTKATIAITVPDDVLNNDNVEVSQIMMDSKLIKTAAQEKKDISVVVKDESGKERYSWSFNGDELAESNQDLESVNVAMTVENASAYSDQLENTVNGTGLVLNFKHEGVLPAPAKVRVYVGDLISKNSEGGFELNDTVYVYYFNSESGKLESLPFSSGYKVDEDGYITITLVHCSDYVILPKAADSSALTSLRKQISVTVDRSTLSTTGSEKTAQIQINLPSTLELVKYKDEKTSNPSIGAVTVTYESGNKKIAKVDSDGTITALRKGKVTITVTITLYSGKTKTKELHITVK